MVLSEIVDGFFTLIYAVFYPVQCLLSMFLGWINIIYTAFVDLVTAFTALFNTVYSFISTISTMLFPGTWGTLILIGFMIVFSLRVYHYLKDISIAGFKI